jgi:hypothetical protein
MELPSFQEAQLRLQEEFLRGAQDHESDKELGDAVLNFILESERVRHRVKTASPEQNEIDQQTLQRLHSQVELGPEYAFVESVFKRLAKDPASAIRYFSQAVQTVSVKQIERAKSPRPRRYDSITRLIHDIVRDNLTISARSALKELMGIEGIIVVDGEIINTQDSTRMSVKSFPSRVSDAKKRKLG